MAAFCLGLLKSANCGKFPIFAKSMAAANANVSAVAEEAAKDSKLKFHEGDVCYAAAEKVLEGAEALNLIGMT